MDYVLPGLTKLYQPNFDSIEANFKRGAANLAQLVYFLQITVYYRHTVEVAPPLRGSASDLVVLDHDRRLYTKSKGSGRSCTFVHSTANQKRIVSYT